MAENVGQARMVWLIDAQTMLVQSDDGRDGEFEEYWETARRWQVPGHTVSALLDHLKINYESDVFVGADAKGNPLYRYLEDADFGIEEDPSVVGVPNLKKERTGGGVWVDRIDLDLVERGFLKLRVHQRAKATSEEMWHDEIVYSGGYMIWMDGGDG